MASDKIALDGSELRSKLLGFVLEYQSQNENSTTIGQMKSLDEEYVQQIINNSIQNNLKAQYLEHEVAKEKRMCDVLRESLTEATKKLNNFANLLQQNESLNENQSKRLKLDTDTTCEVKNLKNISGIGEEKMSHMHESFEQHKLLLNTLQSEITRKNEKYKASLKLIEKYECNVMEYERIIFNLKEQLYQEKNNVKTLQFKLLETRNNEIVLGPDMKTEVIDSIKLDINYSNINSKKLQESYKRLENLYQRFSKLSFISLIKNPILILYHRLSNLNDKAQVISEYESSPKQDSSNNKNNAEEFDSKYLPNKPDVEMNKQSQIRNIHNNHRCMHCNDVLNGLQVRIFELYTAL